MDCLDIRTRRYVNQLMWHHECNLTFVGFLLGALVGGLVGFFVGFLVGNFRSNSVNGQSYVSQPIQSKIIAE
jgi:hypothetical protein